MSATAVAPTYRDIALPSGPKVHYVEAGSPSKPTLLLLHGFPSSSNQFRTLIPRLAASYHLIAPDLPGFGLTTVPGNYVHSFANIAQTIGELVDALQLKAFAMYVFDYGAPTGYRLALQRPEAIKAIISQNGNAYHEGLGAEFWAPLQAWWAKDAHDALRGAVKDAALTLAHLKEQYEAGAPADRVGRIDPTAYTLDYLLNVGTDAKTEVQLDLFHDYGTNVALYPTFHEFFRATQVPVLAVWGRNDPVFVPAGAEAFKRDNKEAVVKLLDGGHFLLETHVDEVAKEILRFLAGVDF